MYDIIWSDFAVVEKMLQLKLTVFLEVMLILVTVSEIVELFDTFSCLF